MGSKESKFKVGGSVAYDLSYLRSMGEQEREEKFDRKGAILELAARDARGLAMATVRWSEAQVETLPLARLRLARDLSLRA